MAICGFGQDWNVSGDNFTTGKVGIGTSTPLYDLDIDRPTPYLRIHSSIYTNSPLSIVKKGGIIFNQENADKTAAIVFAVPPDYHVPGILFETKASWNVPGPGAFDWYDRMFIHPGGNIGIGTVSPNGKLSVYNNFSFNANETASGQDHIIFSGIDPGNGGYFGGLTWESGGRRRASIAATRETADADYVGLAFFTQGTDGPGPMAESMRITRYGRVGIGASNPDATLAVKGSIHTQEVLVDLSGAIAPDYVFEKELTLMPLSDLKQYIDMNKYLPDVPSASEMQADGLNIKEMNLLLLKKAEELTLPHSAKQGKRAVAGAGEGT